MSEQTATRSSARTDSPLALRILGVVAVVVTSFDASLEEMEALRYLAAGLIGGAVVGLVVSVWVGLRVWQSRWTLLVVLMAVAAVTGITIVVATR